MIITGKTDGMPRVAIGPAPLENPTTSESSPAGATLGMLCLFWGVEGANSCYHHLCGASPSFDPQDIKTFVAKVTAQIAGIGTF